MDGTRELACEKEQRIGLPAIPRVLVVACETRKSAIISDFERAGYAVEFARPNEDGVRRACQCFPNLVVLDATVDVDDRLEWCRKFRACPEALSVPLVCLTRPEDGATKFELLEIGADDCLLDINSREGAARLKALLRRAGLPPHCPGRLVFEDIQLDPLSLKVWRRGKFIPLPKLQFDLLRHFMMNPHMVFSRTSLLKSVWSNSEVEINTVTQCIVRLRKALNSVGGAEVIQRTRGGYSLEVEEA